MIPFRPGGTVLDGVWQPAGRRELLFLGGYFVVSIVAADVLNVRLGVELMTLLVVVAAVFITRAPATFLRDWWCLLVGLLLWNLSGPIAAASPFPLHLDFMLSVDRLLFGGRDVVVVVQHSLATPGRITPLDIFTGTAYNMHLPEPYVAGYFLWRFNRVVYWQFAAATLTLLVLGFITFIVFPAVPPWLAASQYHRLAYVYNGFGPFLRAHPLPFHGTPIFYFFHLAGDRVAAFPSQHAAFPVLEYLAWRHVSRPISRWLLLWIALVLFTVLYLGEHWVTDVLAGWIYAVVIFWGVRRFTLWN